MLKRAVLAMVLGALALQVWGFLFWGVMGGAARVGRRMPNEAAVIAAFAQDKGTAAGTYLYPSISTLPDADGKVGRNENYAAEHEKGPRMLVHYQPGGAPAMHGPMMAVGFLHYLVCAGIAVLVCIMAYGPARSQRERTHLILMVGLFGAIAGPLSDPIWWGIPWQKAAYDFTYLVVGWFIAAHVMSWTLGGVKKPAAPAA
ncbi:MAG: hypothetical protein HMLKMBBP_00484 [Planctomycetes bacterium]|nr:hypothetical protein [Planctomycetota bacterium]